MMYPYHRIIAHAAGKTDGSSCRSLGFDFPALAFFSRCFFMASICNCSHLRSEDDDPVLDSLGAAC
jgi:hypothetical protein